MSKVKAARPHTIREWVRYAARQLIEAGAYFGHGTDNANDEAVYLIAGALQTDYDFPNRDVDAALNPAEDAAIAQLVMQRIATRKPVAYLINQAWFAGLPFYVDERTLVPRSPIAELIQEQFSPWIDPERVQHILDIGTGSGCIGVACAYAFPDAQVDATDISSEALQVAERNIIRHHLQHKIRLHQSDVFTQLPERRYDIIVSNPPYVNSAELNSLPAEYRYEPVLGLAAGDDGLAVVRRILQQAARFLQPHGILVVEVGNAMSALSETYPDLPFTWLEFSRGEDGVFLLDAQQLQQSSQYLN